MEACILNVTQKKPEPKPKLGAFGPSNNTRTVVSFKLAEKSIIRSTNFIQLDFLEYIIAQKPNSHVNTKVPPIQIWVFWSVYFLRESAFRLHDSVETIVYYYNYSIQLPLPLLKW